MTEIEVHRCVEGGSIDVTINGERMLVPSDDPVNRERQLIAELWEAAGNELPAVQPQEVPYRLYKSVFIRRLVSDEDTDEAAIMEDVLVSADAKLRLMFNSVEFFVSDDPLFETLKVAVGAALGEGRAEELLAPEQ